MPETVKKTIARTRAEFTGEPEEGAFAGVPRDGSLGLDTCLREQRALRALVALGLFNRRGLGEARPPSRWGLHTLVAYDITMSPRYNRLVLLTNAPHNVAPYLLPSNDGGSSLPGLRLEEFRGRRTYVARHLPTGAELVITGNPSGTWSASRRPSPRSDFYSVDEPLSASERARLDEVPVLSADAECLLAGLATRIATQDPRGRWAIGNWFSDPLRRPGRLNDGSEEWYGKQLWGSVDRWRFWWNGFPYVDDVAASLTAPRIGISGATWRRVGDSVDVRLGTATLSLYGRRASFLRTVGRSA